jgi:transposase
LYYLISMKEDARRLDPRTQALLRVRADKMKELGKSRKAIAEALGVNIGTVDRWRGERKKHGKSVLTAQQRGRKKGTKRDLAPAQEMQIQRKIVEKTPDQLKLAFALWNRKAVCELILQDYGLKMPVRTCGEYLKRWGYTPQKPARRAYEQNPLAVKAWLGSIYPQIAQRAKAEGAEVHWGDETGVRSDCQSGRSYAPKGKTPVVRLRGNRFSINLISSITNQGKVRWMIYRDTLNSAVFIRFLERLAKDTGRKVFLIVDNLRVHHSAPVKAWLLENGHRLELHFLPSYSPERNPDEYLNGDLKGALGRMPAPATREKLEANLKVQMQRINKRPRKIAAYFNHPFVSYAKAA